MSRRQGSGFTGANAIPLGTRNKAIGAKRSFTSSPPRDEPRSKRPDSGSNNAVLALKAAQAAAANLAKLAQLNAPGNIPPGGGGTGGQSQGQHPKQPSRDRDDKDDGDRGRPRKKKSRWGNMIKTEIPGMPAAIPTHLTQQQQKAYIVQLQIEDISRKLKSGDLGIPPNPEDRSPSPEPIYNGEGKRMNTREYRTRKSMEEKRHKLVQQMQELNTEYKPPMDYKPMLQRVSERVMIPQDGNPNINFVGLLIGPRGNTLKKIEKESNCKIMIRGKGSVKEGKIGRKDGQPLPGEDEPLHALVSSTSLENVQKAVAEINTIIKQGIEQPEEENDLRKLQLMELAKLNGTLREDLMPKERAWLKPENQNITNTTICTKCGGRGHLAQDCVAQAPSSTLQANQGGQAPPNVDRAKMDSEYMSLMAELGEGPPSGGGDMKSGGNNRPFNNRGGGNNSGGPGRGGFNNFNNGPPNRFGGGGGGGSGGGGSGGGGRQPWMGRGSRFGGPPNQRPRYGGRGGNSFNGGNNRPPMMNQSGGPPPPWMQSGPYGGGGGGGPPGGPPGGPNQWGGPQGGMGPPSYGGYSNPPPSDGSDGNMQNQMPPWMPPNQDGSNMMGPMGGGGGGSMGMGPMGGGGGGNMYGGGGDQNSGGNYYNQPPPPPPTNTSQPPPPPSSGSGGNPSWQQSWSGNQKEQSDDKKNTSSSNQYYGGDSSNNYSGSYNSAPPNTNMGMGMDASMGGMGYGGMGMWGMGGMNSGGMAPPGPVPPPMPSGPGPVPPPPPSGQGSGDGTQSNMGDNNYGGMGYGNYGMPPAPPPPPPQ